MAELVYDPVASGKRMTIVCFVSGSGTNYRQIVLRDPDHDYLVFSNRPDCDGLKLAAENGHEIVVLSHIPYLREARRKYGSGKVPRNCPERIEYEKDLCNLIVEKTGTEPDLVCLAGYDQWVTDWMVDRYYPRLINVHPGDTTKGYDGLHWVPSAKAILTGDEGLRSTLFFVDKGEDTGPVLVQSRPLNIIKTLEKREQKEAGLKDGLLKIIEFATARGIKEYGSFMNSADQELQFSLEKICSRLQDELKTAGDWEIYPFAVHQLIARGRVGLKDRRVFIDGHEIPEHGYRMEEAGNI